MEIKLGLKKQKTNNLLPPKQTNKRFNIRLTEMKGDFLLSLYNVGRVKM